MTDDINLETKEFNILGHTFKLGPDSENEPAALAAIENVLSQIEKIKEERPKISNDQVAILVALKLATQLESKTADYKKNISKLQSTAADALHLIEEVLPQ